MKKATREDKGATGPKGEDAHLDLDDFSKKIGYTSYSALVSAASAGTTIIKGAKINTGLIEAVAIVANGIKASHVEGLSCNFVQGKFGGFTADSNLLYSGKKFGLGEGITMQSTTNNYRFNVYKDTSHYVEMFYRNASDWGLKGVDGNASKPIFQLGSKNTIGDFKIEGGAFTSAFTGIYDSGVYISKDGFALNVKGIGVGDSTQSLARAFRLTLEGTSGYVKCLEVKTKNTSSGGISSECNAIEIEATKVNQSTDNSFYKYANAIRVLAGDINMNGGCYVVSSGVLPVKPLILQSSYEWLNNDTTFVVVNYSSKATCYLPWSGVCRFGHVIKFLPYSAIGDLSINVQDNGTKIMFNGREYSWALIKSGGRHNAINCYCIGKMNGYWRWIVSAETQDYVSYG